MRKLRTLAGFTLIELILVMVIVSMIIFAGIGYVQQRTEQMRVDRTSAQMQQILNAGLSYFVAFGDWPAGNSTTTITELKNKGLVPNITLNNPWGEPLSALAFATASTNPKTFYVWTRITQSGTTGTNMASANAIMGSLPLSYTTSTPGNPPPAPGSGGAQCTTSTPNCYVVAQVNIPGQDLNNARAVNFAGLYHHGACVPVPQCPTDVQGNLMTPQIMVVPVSVSGINDPNSANVYPITSFTAYAKGPVALPNSPPPCYNPGGGMAASLPDCATNTNGPPATSNWRVCLNIVTEKGNVAVSNTTSSSTVFPYGPWGGDVTLMAITRCAVNNETSGSTFSVYSR